ncbi:MAG: hypothetical protein OEL55_02915 [Desulfobulbaceae bacterium]|nr:hypothetical protein [Desulfobulbaceae bacterium]
MKKVLFALVFLLGGCSGGVNSSLLDMNMNVSLPFLGNGDRQAVVFPYQRATAEGETMVQAYGQEWRSVEGDYPEYQFNP